MTTLEYLQLHFTEGEILQVMSRHGKSVTAGLFDQLDTASKYIAKLDAMGGNAQVVRCPINPDANTVRKHSVTNSIRTKEVSPCADARCSVVARNIMIDVDCVKPSEHKDLSATEEELTAALPVAYAVRDYLRTLGFPEPIILRTGSGYHLIYRTETYNPQTESYAGLLRVLQQKCSSRHANIDASTFRTNTMLRIPGTTSRKSAKALGRTDRKIMILSQPDDAQIISRETYLRAISSQTPVAVLTVKREGYGNTSIPQARFEDILDELKYEWNRVAQGDCDHYYLDHCPVKGDKHANQMRKTIFIWTPAENGRSVLGFKCLAEACSDSSAREVFQQIDAENGTNYHSELFASYVNKAELLAYFQVQDENGTVFDYQGECTLPFAADGDLDIIDDDEELEEWKRNTVFHHTAKTELRKIAEWSDDIEDALIEKLKQCVSWETATKLWLDHAGTALRKTGMNEPTLDYAMGMLKDEIEQPERRSYDVWRAIANRLGIGVIETLTAQSKAKPTPAFEVPECISTNFLQNQVWKEIRRRVGCEVNPASYLLSVQHLLTSDDRLALGKFLGQGRLRSFVEPNLPYQMAKPETPKPAVKSKKSKKDDKPVETMIDIPA